MTIRLTAYGWLTSDNSAAQRWRKQATMEAYNRVYDRAEREKAGGYFAKPIEPIERPPTGRETMRGRYFTVPSRDTGKTGAFFNIPTEGEDQ